jgi:hypothetical protein
MKLSTAVKSAALAFLALALLDLPDEFDKFLRFVVLGGAIFAILDIQRSELSQNWKTGITLAFSALAIIFNPILPLEMEIGGWRYFDALGALMFAGILGYEKRAELGMWWKQMKSKESSEHKTASSSEAAPQEEEAHHPLPPRSRPESVKILPWVRFGLLLVGFVGALFVLYAFILIFTPAGEREIPHRSNETSMRQINIVDPSPGQSAATISSVSQEPVPTPEPSAAPNGSQDTPKSKEVRKAIPVEVRKAIPVEPAKP